MNKEIVSKAERIMEYVDSMEGDYLNGDIEYDDTVAEALAVIHDLAREIKEIAMNL